MQLALVGLPAALRISPLRAKSALRGLKNLPLPLILIGVSLPAHAQTAAAGGGGSLTTFINNIVNLMTGTLGQAFSVLAIALFGMGMAFGYFDMRKGGMGIVGVAIMFSAAWVVSQLTGGTGTGTGF